MRQLLGQMNVLPDLLQKVNYVRQGQQSLNTSMSSCEI